MSEVGPGVEIVFAQPAGEKLIFLEAEAQAQQVMDAFAAGKSVVIHSPGTITWINPKHVAYVTAKEDTDA